MNPDGVLARGSRAALLTVLRPLAPLGGLRVLHADRLPTKPEPLIVTCNHAAYVDTFWLLLATRAPMAVCGAKPRLFRTAARRALTGLGDVRRIDDEAGFHRTASTLLEQGRTVLVYPEMGRNPDGMGPFSPWVGDLLERSKAPVLPCYLWGTTTGQSGGPTVVVGERLDESADLERLREATLALADEARAATGS